MDEQQLQVPGGVTSHSQAESGAQSFEQQTVQPQVNVPQFSHRLWLRIGLQGILAAMYVGVYWLLAWQSSDGWQEIVLLLVGLVCGSVLWFADEIALAKEYAEPGATVRPLSKSLLLVLALVPVGIFVLTSTASVLALGFYIAVSGAIVLELLVRLYSKELESIRQLYLWQLQRSVSDHELVQMVGFFTMFVASVLVLSVW